LYVSCISEVGFVSAFGSSSSFATVLALLRANRDKWMVERTGNPLELI
jgi:hypothetical protein